MEEIVLVGGGGQCKAGIDVIEAMGGFRIAGIVDMAEKLGQEILGYRFFATDEELPGLAGQYRNFLVTVGQLGTGEKRKQLFIRLLTLGCTLPVIVSPSAFVSSHASIGAGTIIQHGAIVNAGAIIGCNCIINSRALVEHDARVGDHCHISTGAIINGGVEVGEGSFVGSGAVTRQYTKIPPYTFIKAAALFKG
jgi:sugar O-acyltransferase (sialic acid O-acetyltransferase NeuD family)